MDDPAVATPPAQETAPAAAPAPAAGPLTAGVTPGVQELPGGPLTRDLAGEGTPAPEAAAVPASPADYKFDLSSLGEVDPALDAEYRDVAHQLGLSQGQAQRLAELYGQKLKSESTKAGQTYFNRLAAQVEEWNQQLYNDPGYNANIKSCQLALSKFSDDEFIKLLDSSGMGSHPAFYRFISRVGKSLREPAIGGQESQDGRKKTLEGTFWPSASKG
jgi:hypothetical protein